MFTAKLNNPANTFTLGWKDGTNFIFPEGSAGVDIPDEAKEYLETYLDIMNRPIFTFLKKEEVVVTPVVTPVEATEKKIIKKAVE